MEGVVLLRMAEKGLWFVRNTQMYYRFQMAEVHYNDEISSLWFSRRPRIAHEDLSSAPQRHLSGIKNVLKKFAGD